MVSQKRVIQILTGIFEKRLELCCPGGLRNDLVDQLRSEGLHFGRLR